MKYHPKCNLDDSKMIRSLVAERDSENIYEQIRMRVVQLMQEYKDAEWTAEILGISESSVRRYMRFVPFEHLMRDPSLENRFDWRSMTNTKWVKLLCKYPDMIRHMKKNTLRHHEVEDVLIAQPQLAPQFDLSGWNNQEYASSWSRVLAHRPELTDQCDFSVITGFIAIELLEKQPQFLDRIMIETLQAWEWGILTSRQPQIEKKMTAKPHSEWPFNYWVHALMFRPELEPEFHDWDKISFADAREFEKCQPEIFQRHHLDQNKR